MFAFHALIHGSKQSGLSALPVTFEAAFAALSELPRMFIEPDGSFVWTGVAPSGDPWQVDGNLIDQGASLAYLELKGRCPEDQFDALLRAFGWPEQPLSFQLPSRGVVLDEVAFRSMAEIGDR